jgi:hypothetical protein
MSTTAKDEVRALLEIYVCQKDVCRGSPSSRLSLPICAGSARATGRPTAMPDNRD